MNSDMLLEETPPSSCEASGEPSCEVKPLLPFVDDRKTMTDGELFAELDRRLAKHAKNPKDVRTWEQIMARIEADS